MKMYCMGFKNLDCQVDIELIEGDNSSLEFIREDIAKQLAENTQNETGYSESYPFYLAKWNVTGYGFKHNSDFTMEVEQ